MNQVADIEKSKISDEARKLGPVVDADAHIDPPCDMWREYLPVHLREMAPVIEEGDECDMAITMHLGGRMPRFGQKQHFLADMRMSKTAMAEPIGIFIYNAIILRDCEGIPKRDAQDIICNTARKFFHLE